MHSFLFLNLYFKVSIRDFINFMNELEKIQPSDSDPIFDNISRKQAEEFISENQNLEVNRNDLLAFIESLTGKTMASIIEEPLVHQENTINTDFLSSRPRSAALNTLALQHPRPRRSNIKECIESSNSLEKTVLENTTFEESLNPQKPSFMSSFVSHMTMSRQLSPISHSTPNKKQFNNVTSSEYFKTPNNQESFGELYKDPFTKSDYAAPKVEDNLEKIVLEGFGSSPSSILCRDISESSFLEKSPRTLQKDENILFLTDLIRKYKDTERQTNALIISHEQHIDELESKVESLSLELKDKKKELFETNSREKNLFGQVTILEKELEKLQHDLHSWEEKYSNMKINCEEQLNEIETVRKIVKEKENELIKSEQLIKDLKENKNSLEAEHFFFSDKISLLKEQYKELESKNQELEEYKFENIRLNEVIERLNCDLEDIKKDKPKNNLLDDVTINTKRTSMNLENELLSEFRDNEIETEKDRECPLNAGKFSINTCIKTLDKGIQVDTLQKTDILFKDKNDDFSLNFTDSSKALNFIKNENITDSEEINNQYNILSHEMNLQNHLIEKLFCHKFKTPKKINKFLRNNLKYNNSFLFLNNIFFKKSLGWVALISYVCITLFIGIWIAHQEWFLWFGKRPKGITYAELKAWKRANSLNFKLYENGIIGFRRTWFEGNWRWINCLGWWIDNSLRDANTQWPS
ncbi:uncharacterized protein T551_02272 [Pneumocystis jirovecii RU7]|uniref:Uncharacterized protein n=1 Tax=Pneumocystis jirovecii (strain RU7) TaxID=1408657 RepID=A0A0W4ZL48_PNEJ7|nr:uncharacterized protein T551_02272 [Pneumocystis jirovecii RU7]KTW28998.1 hypothetical protein T551_02272 [Pneumocystis jirovecii RU7]